MFDRFTDRAKKAMNFAREASERLHHEHLGTEHLLLGLIEDRSCAAAVVLEQMDVDLDALRDELEERIEPGPEREPRRQLPFTLGAKKALEGSLEEACDLGHGYIGTEHLLLGLLRHAEGTAAHVFAVSGVDLESARAEVAEFLGDNEPEAASGPPHAGSSIRSASGRDLTELARRGELESAIGDDEAVERLVRILGRMGTRNAVLLGPAGVVRRGVVEGVARRIVGGNVSHLLRGSRLIEVDLGALLATKRSPPVMIRSLFEDPRPADFILHLREIELLFDRPDAYRAFRAALLGGRSRVLVATTEDVFETQTSRDPGFWTQSFEPVRCTPPSSGAVLRFLGERKAGLERHHDVRFPDALLESAVELSRTYLPDRPSPDAALGLLDEAGAVAAVRGIGTPPGLKRLADEVAELEWRRDEAIARQDFEQAAQLRVLAHRARTRRDEMEARHEESGESRRVEVQERDLAGVVASTTGVAVGDVEARRRPVLDVARDAWSGLEGVLPRAELATRRGSALVLIPNRPELEALYEASIAPALMAHGLEPAKTGDLRAASGALQQVGLDLRAAEVVVAVLTGREPEVMYTLGLCHGIRRSPILLVEEPGDLPSDLRALLHLRYEDTEPGRDELRKNLTTLVGAVLDLIRNA